MSVIDKLKGYFNAYEDDDYDEDFAEETEEKPEPKKTTRQEDTFTKSESSPRVIGGKGKTVSFNPASGQMQVVLVKPERYDDVASIADHLNDRKTVVLNLESADRETSRRIVDFLSGATYANHGNMRKVSKGTFLIVPAGIDMMGEMLLDDLEDGKMYF